MFGDSGVWRVRLAVAEGGWRAEGKGMAGDGREAASAPRSGAGCVCVAVQYNAGLGFFFWSGLCGLPV